eukprot:TRINITY_DN2905_c0_g1_i1.p1 TRINITY_DN2905_c0_g1~~TRINITY_DN2905_c0_g1_i1.p1  ORF type:complete len:222 (-),score=47.49 TRINITY_DN2905_c0_g1_i1:157-774(-)
MSITIYLLAFCVVAFLLKRIFSTTNNKVDPNKYSRNIAIVIGGSFAGIAHARVLSQYYEKVIIFERDKLSLQSFEFRRGVPQGAHTHVVLQKGLTVLMEWFPNLGDALIKAGAKVTTSKDFCTWYGDMFLPRYNFGGKFKLYCCSRSTLEAVLHNELFKIRNIELKDHTTVCSLIEKDGKITGVEYPFAYFLLNYPFIQTIPPFF